MALIANFGELKDEFESTLNRADLTAALKDRFVRDGIRRINRTLRTKPMESSTTLTTTSYQLTLPTDLLEVIALYREADDKQARALPLEDFLSYRKTGDIPIVYYRQANILKIRPNDDDGTQYTLYYYAGSDSDLLIDTDTNAIVTNYSDAVIYAALSYAADYFLDTERKQAWETMAAALIEEIQVANDSAQQMLGPSQVGFPTDSEF